jgi:hypothetical protein
MLPLPIGATPVTPRALHVARAVRSALALLNGGARAGEEFRICQPRGKLIGAGGDLQVMVDLGGETIVKLRTRAFVGKLLDVRVAGDLVEAFEGRQQAGLREANQQRTEQQAQRRRAQQAFGSGCRLTFHVVPLPRPATKLVG